MKGIRNCWKDSEKKAHCRILFTDEKIFNIKEKFNCQNDRIYVKSCYEDHDKIPQVQRGHQPSLTW